MSTSEPTELAESAEFTEPTGPISPTAAVPDASSPPPRSPRRGGSGGSGSGASRATTIALSAFVAIYTVFIFMGLDHGRIPDTYRVPLHLALFFLLLLLGCVAFRRELARAARQIAGHKLRALLILLAGLAGVIVAELIGAALTDLLIRLTGLSGVPLQNDLDLGQLMQTYPPLLMIVVIGVVGPVVEEMFFRQFLIGFIGRWAPTWVAVVVSSILFGSLHMHALALSEAISVIPHAFFGLACGILYVKSGRNLYYSTILHALMNLSAVIPTTLS